MKRFYGHNDSWLNLGARSAEGRWIIAYIAGEPRITLDLTKLTSRSSASAEWIDPATGKHQPIQAFPASSTHSFTRRRGGPTRCSS